MDKQMGPPIGLPEIGEPFGPWFILKFWVTTINQYEDRDDTGRHL
jgi:hypothetical protein